jgi:hypothetical protein
VSGADRTALEAQTDQALAHLAATRGKGGRLTEITVGVARDFAAALRVQFPGRDRQNARVLAAAASMLAGLESTLTERGAQPGMTAPILLNVLGYAADDLNRSGLRDAEGTHR